MSSFAVVLSVLEEIPVHMALLETRISWLREVRKLLFYFSCNRKLHTDVPFSFSSDFRELPTYYRVSDGCGFILLVRVTVIAGNKIFARRQGAIDAAKSSFIWVYGTAKTFLRFLLVLVIQFMAICMFS